MRPRHPSRLALVVLVALAACKRPEPSAEYLAECEGPPLRSVEKRNKAMEDGYEVNRRWDCVSKRSFIAMQEQKAQWEAANTPEAKAAREAERLQQLAEGRERMAAAAKADIEERAERERRWAAEEQAGVTAVEVNSASETRLASIPGMSAEVANQIVTERAKAPFRGWEDVVGRVVGLSAAETAARASAFGLTVNGRSLEGAEPDSPIGRFAREKWRRRGAR